ncbi:TPA: hypothetical protein ACLMQK_004331 [Yersinia enterocolitica]|uniref:hypothetical protein n=1 Tax=Yersinia TaxID=629 RepID=UPI0005DD07F4|nr:MULTISPECIES: hypothetical protein [Yersinia]EKN6007615.1 hypothetical protein [Yersinia enterocolitica]CFR13201.1 Uncharacterised protein [Yersinia kristensenii]CRY75410.1 Uncharacterised protein [Yersinia intermedia]HEN3495162.1 hypothetical protein [Yersinia enterocolitica]
MSNIKIITLFHINEKTPLMTCLIKDIEENESGINLTFNNGSNIMVKDYGFYFLSESVSACDEERIVNIYRKLIAETSQMDEETIKTLML